MRDVDSASVTCYQLHLVYTCIMHANHSDGYVIARPYNKYSVFMLGAYSIIAGWSFHLTLLCIVLPNQMMCDYSTIDLFFDKLSVVTKLMQCSDHKTKHF